MFVHIYEQSSLDSGDQNLGDQNVSSSNSVPSGCNDDSDGGKNEVDFDFRSPLKNFSNKEKRVSYRRKFQLYHYLEVDREDVFYLDLLMWWKSTGLEYKISSLMNQDVLAFSIAIIALESAFSTFSHGLDAFKVLGLLSGASFDLQ